MRATASSWGQKPPLLMQPAGRPCSLSFDKSFIGFYSTVDVDRKVCLFTGSDRGSKNETSFSVGIRENETTDATRPM